MPILKPYITKRLLLCWGLALGPAAVGASLDGLAVMSAPEGPGPVPPQRPAEGAPTYRGPSDKLPFFSSFPHSEFFPTIVTPTIERSSPVGPPVTSTWLPTAGDQVSSLTSSGSAIASFPSIPTTASSSASPSPTLPMTSSSTPQSTTSTSSSSSDANRTLVIALTAIFAVIGLVLVIGAAFLCHRYRQKRIPFFQRGISPIDDEEIESWKISPEERNEKYGSAAKEAGLLRTPRLTERPVRTGSVAGRNRRSTGAGAGTASSVPPTTPTRKQPSAVIVYQNQQSGSSQQSQGYGYRRSEEMSPRSLASSSVFGGSRHGGGRTSMDKDLPQTPLQARAPNAREGLTDESIPGDEPYIPLPKRQPSRISKAPTQITSPRLAHTRTRSSRSSLRSFGLGWDYQSNPYGGYGYHGSEQELHRGVAGRASSDYPRSSAGGVSGYSPPQNRQNYSHHHHRHHHQNSRTSHHSRVYSSSSIPPRLSLSDDFSGSPRTLLREDIGRAIG